MKLAVTKFTDIVNTACIQKGMHVQYKKIFFSKLKKKITVQISLVTDLHISVFSSTLTISSMLEILPLSKVVLFRLLPGACNNATIKNHHRNIIYNENYLYGIVLVHNRTLNPA